MKNAIFNWSGGKDSSFALYKILTEKKYQIQTLLTTINQKYDRVSMHGVRKPLLEKQAENLGISLTKLLLPENLTMKKYDQEMQKTLKSLVRKYELENAIFGDIFLEDLRKYREKRNKILGLEAIFPLWKMNTKKLALDFIEKGFKAILVCVDTRFLGQDFVGRIFDKAFLDDLPKNVDPCGENGEFHTFVFEGPIFKNKIDFKIGEKIFREIKAPRPQKKQKKNDDLYECTSDGKPQIAGFWYCDLVPE